MLVSRLQIKYDQSNMEGWIFIAWHVRSTVHGENNKSPIKHRMR